jgi:hypothetical protein
LRLRGVERDGGQLVFRAQHPPPDPERNLLSRAVGPRGGEVQFSHGAAVWDDAAQGWVADDPGVDEVTVGAGGLVDGLGNRSGEAVTLPVGEVAPVEWPPHIGPAGGQTPGPFGEGTFPP